MPSPDGRRQPGRFLWGPLRGRLGLSLREFSELTGVNRGDLSKAENGSGVSPRVFERVLAAVIPLMGTVDVSRDASGDVANPGTAVAGEALRRPLLDASTAPTTIE